MSALVLARTAEDRAMLVAPGQRVVTGYAPIHRIRMVCRDRMAVGDVEAAYRAQLQFGEMQRWPCPNGVWEGDTFALHDGRHAYIAGLMLGFERLLVAWMEDLE